MKEFYFTAALKSFIYRNDSEALKISNYPPHLLLIFAFFLSLRRKKSNLKLILSWEVGQS